ncbi:MAG: hypothetical protein HQL60_05020, partial [Magnetococcales bacterium]|nr:hypothetical protein [Magnetococcales bacterium]
SVDTDTPVAPSGLQVNGSLAATNVVLSGAGLAITGNGSDGATVAIFNDVNKNSKIDADELLTTTKIEGATWAASIDLFGGTHAIKAIQTNVAGTVSKASTALPIVVQTPGGFDLAADDDTGLSKTDNITNKGSALTISGTAAGAAKVSLFIDGTAFAMLSVSKGLWKTDLALSHSDVPYAITATQTDAAGNSSEPSIPFLLVVDKAAPAAPTDMAVADMEPSDRYITNKTAGLVISGSGEPGASIALLEGKASLGTASVGSGGKWQLTLAKISNGQHALTAKQTDVAGNIGPVSSQVLLVSVDSVAPAAPSNLKFNNNSHVVSGKGEKGATLALFRDIDNNGKLDPASDVILGSSVVKANGNWGVAVDLAIGKYNNIKAIQTDSAGNVSKASSALNITIAAAGLTRVVQSYIHPSPPDALFHFSPSPFVGEGRVRGAIDERMTLLTG